MKVLSALAHYTDTNYLTIPAVAAYFDAREHEAYYRSLKTNEQRRNLHAHMVLVLERFIDLTNTTDGARAVDQVMAVCTSRSVHSSSKSPLTRARAQHPKGIELLGLKEPITFESLKDAYRRAARRHHPDAGGNHEAMIAVNGAFTLLHDLLRERLTIDAGNSQIEPGRSQIETCADYRYNCAELLFRITLDDWSIDTAAVWLERSLSPDWQQSRYARDEKQRLALTEPAGRLAARLAIAGRIPDAKRALGVARDSLRLAKRKGLIYDGYLQGAEAVLSGSKRSRVVVSHPRQAENALRFGVIDEKQYRKALEEYLAAANEQVSTRVSAEGELLRHQSGGGFLRDLPTDNVAQGKVVRSRLIPEPGYYVTRIASLNDDQQAEYNRAFSSAGSLDLTRKYLFVRLASLFESVLLHPDSIDADAAAHEAVLLGTLHDGSGPVYAAEVATAIRDLVAQGPEEQRSRATLIAAILVAIEDSRNDFLEYIKFFNAALIFGSPLTEAYMRSVLQPLSHLQVVLQTGEFPESADERREKEIWNRDIKVLKSHEIKSSKSTAWAAMDIAKSNPEEAIVAYTQYCETLLHVGELMVHVEELQLGYWIDRLTGVLVRLKLWQEAVTWLEKYLSLPIRYRKRSSPSEDRRLRKRLDHCKAKLMLASTQNGGRE